MKKLHLFLLLILTTNLLNAQLDLSSPWGVVGSAANNWGNDGPDLPFYKTDVTNVFVAYVTLTDGEIKFRENNDWANNYGDNDTNGTLESGGANITVSAGIYKIVMDLNLFTYTIENYTWGLVGSDINGWGATPDLPLIYDPYSDKWRVLVTLGIGELLIRFNNDWTLNYGDLEPNGILDINEGNNIAITAAGDYLVTVDFNTLEYSIEPTWLLSTFDTGTGYNWPDIPLTYNPASDQWSAEVTFATSELLISQNNGLGLTYGDTGANGILDQDGDAIVVSGGNYLVTVDFNSLEYFIESTFNYNWGLVGPATPNGWSGPDLPFYSTDVENEFVAYVTLNDGLVKIRENNSWTLNYGDNEPDGVLEEGGANIAVSAGTYKIVFNFDALTYSIENYSWGLVGSDINDWGNAGDDIPFTYDPVSDQWRVEVSLLTGEFKIRQNNDWALPSYGDNEPDGILDFPGVNIAITAGDYLIAVDFDILEYFIYPQFVSIPDPNFEQALIDLEIDSDPTPNGLIYIGDALSVSNLNVNNRGITSMQGIEAFINLTYLNVWGNPIGSLDVTQNTELDFLWCGANQLTSLDITQNTKLKTLWAWVNELTELDTSNNLLFEDLQLGSNLITDIDVTNNVALTRLHLHRNLLTSVDVSQNVNLDLFSISNNPNLEIVNVSLNPALNFLQVSDLPLLTSLDLSNNPIANLWISDNPQLASVDLRNGNNINITTFEGANTPNLTCINADVIISQVMIDSGKTFNEDCGDFVYIPDPFFEQSLIDIGVDSDGVVNTYILRTDAEAVTDLNIVNPLFDSGDFANPLIVNVTEKVTDLTGIEAFVNITFFNFHSNDIANVDLSSNTELVGVFGNHCGINTIDVSNSPNLLYLHLWDNQITSLDLSNNLALEQLNCPDNLITDLDVSNNTNLNWLLCNNNQLTSLNIANGNNVNFVPPFWFDSGFWANGNPNLACIQVDPEIVHNVPTDWIKDDAAIYSSDCATKPEYVYILDQYFEQSLIDIGVDSDGAVNTWLLIADAEAVTDLNLTNPLFDPSSGFANPLIVNVTEKIADLTGIEAFVNLTKLGLGHGALTNVDISNNVLLDDLFFNNNLITTIDVSNNILLTRFGVMYNPIVGEIDVNQNTLLEELFLHGTGINSINLSNNINLWKLYIQNNNLTSLDISSNIDLTDLRCQNNQLSQLDISVLPAIGRVDAHYNPGLKLITTAITGSPTLTSLNLSGTGLSNFNPTLYPNLEWLLLTDNSLSKLTTTSISNLKNLFINNNDLTSLDLSSNLLLNRLFATNNLLTDLNVQNGNNPVLAQFDVSSNLLTCITTDSDDELIAPYNTWVKDVGVILSLNCGGEPEVILIPDANFENALIAQDYDTNGIAGSILKSEAEAVESLNVNGKSILDLTGIEGFINLTDLDVSNNLLTDINLLENKDLINVNVSGNLLSELFINSGRDLATLNCSDNQIILLNFADLTDLEVFNGAVNLFENIDATSHDLLTNFNVSFNMLTELDMRNGNNTAITLLDVTNNPGLLCIGVDDSSSIPVGWSKDVIANYSNDPDCIPPIIVAQVVTLFLDNKGDASVIADDFDNGSFDNVTLNADLTFSVDIEDFDCSNLGSNNVELAVTDEAGNFSTENVIVNVVDNIPPSVSADPTFSYDLNGMAFNLTVEDIHKSSADNCGDPVLSIDQSLFTSPGIYIVTLTATDGSSNTAEDTTEVIIEDSAASTDLKFKKNLVLTIYPVPFTDVININFSKPTDLNTVQVVLFDFNMMPTGIQFSPNSGSFISDYTGALSSGMYIMQITVNGETKTVMIVKP
jgi:Leucine-rich repeat (LRR) protein